MSVSTMIARRYMQAGRNNRFFSWISLLTIAGVTFGVAAMIVVWSVINGFETELKKRFLAANAHIMAYRFPHGLSDPETWTQTIERDFPLDVKGVSPFIHYETMARRDSILHAVLIRGVNPALREKVQSLTPITSPSEALTHLVEEEKAHERGASKPDIPSVILGVGLLSLLDGKIGDTIELVEPGQKHISAMKKFKVVGVYDSGLKHYDNKLVLMSIPTAQNFFGMDEKVTGLEIGLAKPWQSVEIAGKMSDKYALSIKEWQSFNKPLFETMEMERVVILLVTALVAVVAAFNILTTIFVAVTQRQKDISILKALGASNKLILVLFLKQGLYVGVLGGVLGMILAGLISMVLERYQFVDLPDLYLLAKLPMSYDWWVYAGVFAASLTVSAIAGLFPAWMASKTSPVEGFRGTDGQS